MKVLKVPAKKPSVIFYARVKPETKKAIETKAKTAGFGKGVGKFLDSLAEVLDTAK